jgi:hypothetical protein
MRTGAPKRREVARADPDRSDPSAILGIALGIARAGTFGEAPAAASGRAI